MGDWGCCADIPNKEGQARAILDVVQFFNGSCSLVHTAHPDQSSSASCHVPIVKDSALEDSAKLCKEGCQLCITPAVWQVLHAHITAAEISVVPSEFGVSAGKTEDCKPTLMYRLSLGVAPLPARMLGLLI